MPLGRSIRHGAAGLAVGGATRAARQVVFVGEHGTATDFMREERFEGKALPHRIDLLTEPAGPGRAGRWVTRRPDAKREWQAWVCRRRPRR